MYVHTKNDKREINVVSCENGKTNIASMAIFALQIPHQRIEWLLPITCVANQTMDWTSFLIIHYS